MYLDDGALMAINGAIIAVCIVFAPPRAEQESKFGVWLPGLSAVPKEGAGASRELSTKNNCA